MQACILHTTLGSSMAGTTREAHSSSPCRQSMYLTRCAKRTSTLAMNRSSNPRLQPGSLAVSPGRSARRPWAGSPTTLLTNIESPSQNGRETLGLRPALRQAAPGRRQGRGEREAAATRRRASGFGQSHDRPPTGDSLREFVLRSLRLHPWRHSGRGLPTRHSLRERRLPLDVS
jgi:hypothetical protein